MTPEAILAAITAVANALTEGLKLAQTEEGKKWVSQMLADRQAWDKFWKDAGSGVAALFKGDLFK